MRVLSAEDVADLYRMRRVIEGAAVRNSAHAPRDALAAVKEAVTEASRAADEGRWRDVGTANIRFHQNLAALNGSPRLDEVMRQLLAELRLVFHVMKNPRAFHEPFVARNLELVELMEAGRAAEAGQALEIYLDDAEKLLIQAYIPEP